MSVVRRYGWKPDLPSQQPWRTIMPSFMMARRSRVSLRSGMTPCYDQGQLGSCTGNMLAGIVEYCRGLEKLPPFRPSRLAIYYGEREEEGTIESDAGAMISDGIDVLRKQGAGPEDLWPYDVGRFTQKPPPTYYAAALKDLVKDANPVRQDVDEVCTTLSEGWPVGFGFTVYESFESDAVARTGVVPMPGKDEGVLGGHAVLIVGYDDERRMFEVRNSWGTNWGDGGYFWMPYGYALSPDMASDFWQVDATGG